jgi:hypothetical protein
MADSSLMTWLKNIAGSFGTELSLGDSDYAVVIDWTLEALCLDAEQSPLTSAEKAVGRACLWLRVMGLMTGSSDAFNRAQILYDQASDVASVYLPDITGLVKAVEFYSPYDTTLDEDYV